MEKIHNEIGLPLKATFSDIETDEDMKRKIAEGEDRFYTS